MKEIITKLQQIEEKFKTDFDYVAFEASIKKVVNKEVSSFIHKTLQSVLKNASFLDSLRQEAGKKCLSYEGHRFVSVNIWNGEHILVSSPYFYSRKQKKKGRKKNGRKAGNNIDGHLGLSVMGFISRFSPALADEICKTSVLAPSEEMAVDLLYQKGTELNVKTLRKVCRDVFNLSQKNRGKLSFSQQGQNYEGLTLVIGSDGGRMRTRKNKVGRMKKGQKRQSYEAGWKEPKLFSFYFTDNQGKVIKDIEPAYDATLKGKESFTELLTDYLSALPAYLNIERVVFTADGAPWIWAEIEYIIKNHIDTSNIQTYQVLDYTHAKQALGEIFELLPKRLKQKERLWEKATNMLWKGQIDNLKALIEINFSGKNKQKALKKWNNYFDKNRKRMQYEKFLEIKIPRGSGSVESAIRRVINMRLKSAGSFWLKEWAEVFLFIRAQIISGRWKYVLENLTSRFADNYIETDKIPIKTNDFMKQVA